MDNMHVLLDVNKKIYKNGRDQLNEECILSRLADSALVYYLFLKTQTVDKDTKKISLGEYLFGLISLQRYNNCM